MSLVLLVATALGLYNVYADNTEVRRLAERTACGERGCVRLLGARRTPISQSFTFQTSIQPQRSAQVGCERAYLLVGEFSCSGTAAVAAR
ncbi:MAG TPA: hypothetical protein VG963_02085 [Polyangiaceae bacterium]|nr:hypothetical protein [Polyangiaceae bacterium]